MKIRVPVTWDDICRGESCDAQLCPVARALRRAIGCLVEVQPDWVALGPKGWIPTAQLPYSAELPAAARDFIQLYDEGLDVEPFTFEIDWEEPT